MSVLNKLVEMQPGEHVVYWTGLLAEACENKAQGAAEARSEAWFAYEKGLCYLVQARVAPDACEYRAIRSARVWR